jgi:hypothetical protein
MISAMHRNNTGGNSSHGTGGNSSALVDIVSNGHLGEFQDLVKIW